MGLTGRLGQQPQHHHLRHCCCCRPSLPFEPRGDAQTPGPGSGPGGKERKERREREGEGGEKEEEGEKEEPVEHVSEMPSHASENEHGMTRRNNNNKKPIEGTAEINGETKGGKLEGYLGHT